MFEHCYICGEEITDDLAEMYDPEMYDPDDPEGDIAEFVHGECGVAAGWEVA